MLDCDSRNVFFVEQARFVKLRVLEFASRLADEVIDLGSCNASDFVLDRRQAARADRQFPFSAQREQSALALDLHFARKLRHRHDCVVIFGERIIAERAHAFGDANVKLAISFDPHSKRMLSILRFFRRDGCEFDRLGLLEHIVWHVGRALPFRIFIL